MNKETLSKMEDLRWADHIAQMCLNNKREELGRFLSCEIFRKTKIPVTVKANHRKGVFEVSVTIPCLNDHNSYRYIQDTVEFWGEITPEESIEKVCEHIKRLVKEARTAKKQ
jgi:hypothetical protein